MNGFKFTRQRDNSDPRNIYLNLDGSSYGSRGLTRFVTTPYISASVITVVSLAAAESIRFPEMFRQQYFIMQSVSALPLVGVSYYLNRSRTTDLFRLIGSVMGHSVDSAVINRTGKDSNPALTVAVAYTLHRTSTNSLKRALLFGGVFLALHVPPSFFIAPLMIAARCAWDMLVSRKLWKSEWSIETDPPPPKEKSKTYAGRALTAKPA